MEITLETTLLGLRLFVFLLSPIIFILLYILQKNKEKKKGDIDKDYYNI